MLADCPNCQSTYHVPDSSDETDVGCSNPDCSVNTFDATH